MSIYADKLLAFLRRLEELNPDIPERERRQAEEWAAQCVPAEDFAAVAATVERLIILYNAAPAMQVGQAVLREYFQALEDCAHRLIEAGQIRGGSAEETGTACTAVPALCRQSGGNALEHCMILNRADIPEALSNAADAFRRRVEVVDTVFGLGMDLLWRIDETSFQQWAVDYLARHEGRVNPEVMRDFLSVMRKCGVLRPELLERLFEWCGDFTLLEHWPVVTRHADRLLGRLAVERWCLRCGQPKTGPLAHLKLLVRGRRLGENELQKWLSATLLNFGEGVERFIALKLDDSPEGEAWRRTVLLSELRTLAALYPVIMVNCDHLLTEPDGAAKMAMAFLGIVGRGLREWEERIARTSEKAILRSFLYDLREGRKPTATIRRYTFGDDTAFQQICNQLDLVSQRFDSLAQRDAVIRKLAVYYASYRRGPLLGIEVAKRYRHLAKILHVDFLKQFLSDAEMVQLRRDGFLEALYNIAAVARRFLDRRRALEMNIEEIAAAQMEFIAETRHRRLAAIRQIMAV